MRKIKLHIELTYDDELMHGEDDPDAKDWFINTILKGDGLYLAERGEIDDEIGTVKILSNKTLEKI